MAKASETNSEWLTRKKLIDPMVTGAGWRVVPHKPGKPLSDYDRCAIEEYPTDHGPADYAFCVNGQILGVVEAKKVSLGPQNVLVQAERYSKGISDGNFNFRGYRVPFLYSTNGEVFWHHDIRHPLSRSRRVAGFHTPEALQERLFQDEDASADRLRQLPNDHHLIRPYQKEANQATETALANRKRQMLLAMATGTGKTFTVVNQVYRLMKTETAKRILFLVDRRALAAQAVRAFASFEAEPGQKFDKIYEVYSQRFQKDDLGDDQAFDPQVLPASYLQDPQPGHAFVYVCTIQRMTINLFGRDFGSTQDEDGADEDADKIDIPIHAFDLIIADECHRGYTASDTALWQKTLAHFDAIKIGLTATPAAHTTSYFKEIVFRYDYERAVREGYLVDYDVVKINSDVRMNGMFLEEGEQVKLIDTTTGDDSVWEDLEDERQYDATEVEEKITSPDSNRKIMEEIKIYFDEHQQQFGRPPKTLIFAVNDIPHISHADSLVDIARDVFGQGDSFVQKITGSPTVDRPLQRIREFRNRRQPAIVVTVDMLSTGVDIPDLEFIVFLRPVKSRILFEQMMGRGTRKGEHFPDKTHFVVFDCFNGTLLEYFKQSTGITAEPPQAERKSLPEIIQEIWDNKDRDYNIKRLVKRLHRIEKSMSGEAREMFAKYVEDGDIGKFATRLPRLLKEDFKKWMTLLRDKDFQDLLENYPKAQRTFIVAPDYEDTVTSEWMVRGTDGKEYKPSDYLTVFSEFVRKNPEHIEAIRILRERPKDWSTEALQELRKKLAATPQRFTVENLQRAHNIHYQKALADIISMVKHAADEQSPLMTAKERVERVFQKVTDGNVFTEGQRKWLDRIREHLINNLSIDQDDFEYIPIFSDYGGWGPANRDFNGKLDDILKQFNEALAI